MTGLGVPAGIDAEFADSFRRWENLQAAAAQNPTGSAAATTAAAGSKGFSDGLRAWLSPGMALDELESAFRNLDSTNVGYLGGLLSIPLGVLLLIRRR